MKNIPLHGFRKVPKAEARDRIEAARKGPVAPLLGYDLVCAKRRAMARHIVARVGAHKKSTINFVNAHCINVEGCDAEYRHALKDSDLLLPDGVGLEIAGQMCGATLGDNLNGTDLFPEICREANEAVRVHPPDARVDLADPINSAAAAPKEEENEPGNYCAKSTGSLGSRRHCQRCEMPLPEMR